jgi:hypothetical protein
LDERSCGCVRPKSNRERERRFLQEVYVERQRYWQQWPLDHKDARGASCTTVAIAATSTVTVATATCSNSNACTTAGTAAALQHLGSDSLRVAWQRSQIGGPAEGGAIATATTATWSLQVCSAYFVAISDLVKIG